MLYSLHIESGQFGAGGGARFWIPGSRRRTAGKRPTEAGERDAEFSTMSGVPVKPLYTPEDVEGDFEEKIGYPSEYPYTRGV